MLSFVLCDYFASAGCKGWVVGHPAGQLPVFVSRYNHVSNSTYIVDYSFVVCGSAPPVLSGQATVDNSYLSVYAAINDQILTEDAKSDDILRQIKV